MDERTKDSCFNVLVITNLLKNTVKGIVKIIYTINGKLNIDYCNGSDYKISPGTFDDH
ncbi:MAG: hypothetical protein HeimC3_30140 [Candidatus Heimdallarchaeota archaeon LC_3]|nr:MAG: hypothetical protein HeimC3_30140 [Candidatus Heimdallarchaeota archaeon LC_3]